MLKKIIGTGLSVAIFTIPVLVSALTDDTPTSPQLDTPFCPNLVQTLQKGARDVTTVPPGQVSELQAFLTDYYNLPDGLVSGGYFGNLTKQYVVQFQNEKGLPAYGIVGSLTRAAITASCQTPSAPNTITVTSPNGGEQWEIGQLNTITWSPYSYNPDSNPAKDVNVFLERLDGSTVGQVMDTGKASLHTYFNIGGYNTWAAPGQYRIYVANKVTGATDRSDAPFTLLPRPVDLKVNGSDGPVTLSEGQTVTLSWSSPAGSVCTVSGVRDAGSVNSTPTSNGQTGFSSLPASSSGFSAVFIGTQYAGSIYMTCALPDGRSRSDSVGVNPGAVMTSLKVIYPNGGESFDPNKEMTITLNQTGLKSVSIALYKNDQWKYWIAKDIQPANTNWIPAGSLQGLGEGDNAGAIWKIYITGQKADGTGYVDDKSDTPFSFVASPVSRLSCSLIPDKNTYVLGETITVKWTSQNATYASWVQATSGKDTLWLPGDKLAAIGYQSINASVTGNPTITLRIYNSLGQSETCSLTISIFPPPTSAPNGLSVDKVNYTAGESIKVTWGYSGAPSAQDWVVVGSKDVVYTSSNWPGKPVAPWFYTNAAPTGTNILTAPSSGGSYQLIYFLNNGFTEAMRSPAFTVYSGVTLDFVSPPLYRQTDQINVAWKNNRPGGAGSNDWAAIVPVGANWQNTQATQNYWVRITSNSQTTGPAGSANGTISFKGNIPIGKYQVVYYLPQNSDGTYTELARSQIFEVITASTPVSCQIKTDKPSYNLGDTIVASWTSTNASYASWVPDTSGKDTLKLPGDKLEISGYQQILASVIGNSTIVLRVTNASGQTNTCSTVIPIGPPVIDSSADIKFNGQDSAITVHVGDAPFQMNFTTKNVYSCNVTVMGPMPSGPSSFPTSYSGPSGAIVVGLVGLTNFLFSCTTPSGGLVSDSIQMTVLPPASAAANSGTEANLASALTALQSVLEKLIAELSQ